MCSDVIITLQRDWRDGYYIVHYYRSSQGFIKADAKNNSSRSSGNEGLLLLLSKSLTKVLAALPVNE